MPVYEYVCQKCSDRFEKLIRSMSSKEAVACPRCGSKKTERELSTFAVGGEGGRASSAAPARPRGGCGGGCCGGACSHR